MTRQMKLWIICCGLTALFAVSCGDSGPTGPGHSGTATFDAPSMLEATPLSSSEIELSWQYDSDAEDGFLIYRTKDGSAVTELAGQTGADETSFRDSGLEPGANYTYHVVAVAGGEESLPSNEASASTASAQTLPAAPEAIEAVSHECCALVRWIDVADNEQGYRIERSSILQIPGRPRVWTELGRVDANITQFEDCDPLSIGADYRVVAYNEAGNSEYASARHSGFGLAPRTPENLQAKLLVRTMDVMLTWEDLSNNETGFVIYRTEVSLEITRPRVFHAGANSTSFVDREVTVGKTYSYTIRAINDCKQSDLSASARVSVSAFLAPAAPQNASAAKIGTTLLVQMIGIAWEDRSSNESAFVIKRYRLNRIGFWVMEREFEVDAGSEAAKDGLREAGTYRWEIRSKNRYGLSEDAAVTNQITIR